MAGLLSDELSKQMDADLFGEPKKSSLDPKLSDEMDKDLGLAPSRPWSGAIKPPEPEEPGYLGALGKGIYTGFRRRLPEQIGQAIQFTGIAPETGKAIAQLGTEGEVRPEFKNPIKQVLYEGGEMLAPSMAIPAALGAAGVGAIPASVATAALFGLSQAQATKEEAQKRGVEPGAAPYATGTIEALGEAAGTYYLTRLLGPLAPLFKAGMKTTTKEVIKPTLGRLIKEFPKTLAVEAGTEFGQQAGEAAVEKYAGIRPEAEPLKEGLGVIGPTAVLTSLTMGAAHPFSRIQGRKLEKILTDPKIDPETREAAVNAVSSYMEEADKNISERWKQKALETVKQGQPIPMDEDIYEWIGLKPKQAIPTEPKTEETGAIPVQPKGYDLITKKSEEPEAPAAPAGAIPQPEKTSVEEAKDLLQTLQKVPGAGKPAPAIPEAPGYTEEEVRAALGGMEQPKAAIGAREKPEAPKGAVPAIEQGEKENLEKIRALNENTERLIREGGYEVAKRQPRSREGEAALLKKGYIPMLWNPQTGQLEKNVLGEWVRKKGEEARPEAAIPAATEEKKDKEPWEMSREEYVKSLGMDTRFYPPQPKREGARVIKISEENVITTGEHGKAVWEALKEGKPVPPEVLKDYPELQPKQAIPIPAKIEEAAAEAATSPANKLPEPTEAQKEAGNYQKGHVNLQGLDISIENPRGSTRSGVSPEGKKWETTLAHHYGYIRGTKGKDKDHLDVFIGPHPDSEFVTVIDQVDPKTGKFDEHKIMLGFQNLAEGQVGYLANYEPGWKGLGAAKGFDILEFKDWLKEGDTTKPIAMKGAIPFAERRKDLEKRKRLAEMTPEEMKEELLTDPLTGLGNRRAYEESPRLPIQAMIDVDSLKAVNDTMGHGAGDNLLKAVGNSLRNLLASRAYHTSGDEFIVEGPTRELVENQLRGIREELAGAEIEATAPDGTKYRYKGLEISYGIGTNLKEADDALSRDKQERERKGLRAPRGERPKGLAAIPAPGVQTEGEAPAGEIEEPKTLPANWIDAGWKIQDRGVLQIAISPEGKEYALWGQRLQPTKEPEKVIPAEKEEAEPAAEEAEEEEVTPRSIPFEAVKYANAIKNKLKKNYAWSYLKWKTGKTEGKPDPKGLSTLAAQIVRISVNKILGEPYKFKPQVGEAKTDEKDNIEIPDSRTGKTKEEGAKPKEKEPASEHGEELKPWDAWREQPRKEIPIEPEKIGKVETPKEQKKYLVDAIDEAVGQAPEKWIEGEYVLIEVPNDGTFRIKNEIATLQAFKKKAQTIEAAKEDQTPKRPPAMRAARGRLSGEGVEYYNEFKPRGKGIYLDPSKYQYGSGFYTNGVYMVKTEKPEVPPKAQVLREGKQSDESVSTLLADFASKSKEPAQIVGEFHLGTSENEVPKADLIDKKGRHVLADAKLIDSVLAKHPEAKPFVNGKEPQISPIVFKKGDEIVGVVMPMRLDQNEQNFVKEGAKRVLGETEEAAKPKTAKQTEKQPAGEAIGDFGKKIGGARKDLWKERGLSIADVDGMTQQERESYTKKAHIWPSADYEQFVKDGMPPEVAYLVKRVKDAIAVEPDLPTSAKSSPELREKNFRRYIELVSALRDRLPKVRTPEDIRAIKTELFPTEPTGGISGGSRYTKESNADLLLLGGKSVSDALQPRSFHIMDAKEKVKKTGFPAKQEAWQKQYDVHFTKAGSKVFREGKETTTEKDEWLITKKDKHSILQDGFFSREEAEAWAKDQSKATGERLTRPFRENIERTGPDYRKGRDITGDEILAEFGFRGGEFGNWTNQEDRKQALNEAYDGLRDLADTLKVPPKALSLNGELGLAFGARGGGSASAHYEPGRVVINLTKTRGAGSLAHEWAHAVDDYFGRMATGGIPGKYVSHGERGAKESGKVRPEMLQAWAGAMKAISDRVADKESSLAFAQKGVKQMTSYVNSWLRGLNEFIKNNPKAKADTVNELVAMLRGEKPKQWNGEKIGPQETAAHLRQEADQIGYKMAADDSKKIGINAWHLERAQVDLAKAEAGELTRGEKTDFLKNALERGSGKGDNYWARKHELFARAFESFVEDRIEESGNKSEYLVHSTKESPTSPWGQIYPHGRDRAAINAAFEKWVQTLKTKEEGSHTVLFKLEERRSFGPSIDELLAKPDVPVVEVQSKFRGKFKEARVWALSNLRGEPVENQDSGMKIVISRDAIEKATSASAIKEGGRAEHLEALQKLRDLLRNAILAESYPDRAQNQSIKAIHKFYAPVDIDGKIYSVKLTIKEYVPRTQRPGFYTYELAEIEMPAAKRPVAYSETELSPGRQTGISKLSVADLLKNAMRNDGTPFISSAPETSLKSAEGRGEIKPEIIPATAATPEELREIEETIRKIAPAEVSFKQALYLDMRKEKNQAALLKHGYSERDLARIIADGNVYFKVAGRMTPVRFGQGPWEAIINVATGGKDALQVKGDALHEAFEAVRSFMLTDEEVKILDARYPGKEGRSASEVQADAFADWVKNEKRPVPRSAKTIFEKIRQFFERFSNFLEGLGFKTAEDIFEAASEGGIRERYEAGGREAAPETAFKMEPVEQAEVKEALAHPEASVMEAVQEKQHLKSLIRAEIEGEDIPEGSAVRFADAGYIKSVLRQGRLPEGGSFEGRAGISATKVKRGITPVAYGSNYKHSAAIAIPKEYIRGTGNAPNEVLVDPKVPLDRLRFYIDGQDRSFSIDELREAGEFREERVPAFKLEGPIRNIIDSLKSPDLPAEAEQDKGFKDSIKKTRLGLVKVTDNDLKLWERALSLPFWLQDKYKELRPLVHTQMKREENRSETIHGLLNRARPFFALKGDEMAKVEKALVQGDREGKVYEEKELREKFNLGSEGIEGYRAVRKTLDWIHAEWKARIEENILREYKKEKWFALFKAAHGLEFSDEETLALDRALKKTRKAMEKPVETVRAHLQRVFEEEFSPRNKQLLADLLGDYMKAYRRARKQIDKIKEIVRDAIGEGMSEEDLNKNTQALVQAYIRSLPAMQQLKELRSELNRIRGYFPRSRKMGKYRVVVTDSFEDAFGKKEKFTVFYQNAANRLEATKIHDKIKADPEYKDLQIAIEPNRQEAETTFMGASAINMQRLVDNAIDKLRAQGDLPAEIASLIRMNVLETLADELKARGAGRFAIRRAENIIEGYQKTNLKEVLKDYIDGWSGMITKQEAALEFLDELKEIPRSKPQVMAYGSKYAQDMLRNQEPMDRISAKMRSLAFLYFLGGSLRAATVNFTQNYVTGIPFLAREVGAKSLKAEKIYHKAMFDVALGKNLNEVEKRMLDEMINKGVAEDQFIRQINREVKGALGQWTGKVVDILAKPFSWMEKLNRKSAALSMFRVKMEKFKAQGMDAEEAYRKSFSYSQDFVYKTHYLMTKANLPSMAAGGDVGAQFLKTAYTFRRFTHNYLLSLHHSLKGPEGSLALDVMARSLAYVVLLAGIPAIPFLDDLLDEWEKFFGTPVRSNMRKTLRDAGGPVLERMGMAGIPALIGIDISGSLKTGIPLIGAGTPQDTIYGVYGGMAKKALNAMSAVERENYLRALEFASPAFIEAVLKAYRMSETGVTTPRGKMITDEQGRPIRLGTGEGVAQAAGFRPERLARISGEHWTMENVQKHFKEKKDDLYSRYRLARTPEEKQRVIRDMQRFNLDARKYRGVIPPITATSLRQAALQKPEKAFLSFGKVMEASP